MRGTMKITTCSEIEYERIYSNLAGVVEGFLNLLRLPEEATCGLKESWNYWGRAKGI